MIILITYTNNLRILKEIRATLNVCLKVTTVRKALIVLTSNIPKFSKEHEF